MKRTTSLKLQKPETGDVYSSTTLTQNVSALDKIMAEIGGNVQPRYIAGAEFISKVIQQTHSSDWSIDAGWLTIHGNGMASIYINATSKKVLNVSSRGHISGANTLCTIHPEYATAITQPLRTGVTGRPGFGAYIAPNTTRVVLITYFGYTSTGTIPAGEEITLTGTFPLAMVPKGIGLEQMPPQSFNSDVHTRNLIKIDEVAAKLKVKRSYLAVNYADMRTIFTPAPGINVTYFYYRRLRSGQVDFIIEIGTALPTSSTGTINNVTLGTFKTGYAPDRACPIATTSTYASVSGTVELGGDVKATGTIGRNISVREYRLAGSWHSGK